MFGDEEAAGLESRKREKVAAGPGWSHSPKPPEVSRTRGTPNGALPTAS